MFSNRILNVVYILMRIPVREREFALFYVFCSIIRFLQILQRIPVRKCEFVLFYVFCSKFNIGRR